MAAKWPTVLRECRPGERQRLFSGGQPERQLPSCSTNLDATAGPVEAATSAAS